MISPSIHYLISAVLLKERGRGAHPKGIRFATMSSCEAVCCVASNSAELPPISDLSKENETLGYVDDRDRAALLGV